MEMEIGFWSYGRLQEDKKELGEEEEKNGALECNWACIGLVEFVIFISLYQITYSVFKTGLKFV